MRYGADGSVYEGEFKEGLKDGYGTMKFANGNTFEGHYKDGTQEGPGTYRFADGRIQTGFYKANAEVGEGVAWTADKQSAWRLFDGAPVGEEAISLDEARKLLEAHGLPVPTFEAWA